MFSKKQVKKIVLPVVILALFIPIASILNQGAITTIKDQVGDSKTSDPLYTYSLESQVPLSSPHPFWVNDYYNGIGSTAIWPTLQPGWAEAEGGGTNLYNFDGWSWQNEIQIVDEYYFDVIKPDFDNIPLEYVPFEEINVKFRLRVAPRTPGGGFCRISIKNHQGNRWQKIQEVDFLYGSFNFKTYDIDIEDVLNQGYVNYDVKDYINDDGQVAIQVHSVNWGWWQPVLWWHVFWAAGLRVELDLATVEAIYAYSDSPLMIITPIPTTYDIRDDNLISGLEVSFLGANGVPEIETVKFKLDGLDPITLPPDRIISLPDVGEHTTQVLGYDINGIEYSSQIQSITIIDGPIIQEDSEVVLGNHLSGSLADTLYLDGNYLSVEAVDVPLGMHNDPDSPFYGVNTGVMINIDLPNIRIGSIRVATIAYEYEAWTTLVIPGSPGGPLRVGGSSLSVIIHYLDGSQEVKGLSYDGFDEISVNPYKYIDFIQICHKFWFTPVSEMVIYKPYNPLLKLDYVECFPYTEINPDLEEKIAVFFWATDAGTIEGINRYISILMDEGYTKFFNFMDTDDFEAAFNIVDLYEDNNDVIFFYLQGHGNVNPEGSSNSFTVFKPGGVYIYASQFRTMMDRLETSKRAHLVESCHAGGWVYQFQSQPYLAISSTDANRNAAFANYEEGPGEGEFSMHFFDHVEAGFNAIDSFYYAKNIVDASEYPQYPEIADYSSYDFFAD